MRYLLLAALASTLPAVAGAQGIVTFTTGLRGPTGPRFDQFRAGPILGIDVRPVRWKWGSFGVELSHAPRMSTRDSGAYNPPGQLCMGPDQVLTTCGSSRSVTGEATSQLGALAHFGPALKRTAPFVELAVGYYRTSVRGESDVWDTSGRHLTNLSGGGTSTDGGVYARAGVGVEVKPWTKGPALSVSARYRFARRGDGPGAWFEWFNVRSGGELALGVRF